MSTNNAFGETLTELRRSRNMSARKLALSLKVSGPYICDVENGRRAPLTYERLQEVKKVLDLTEEEFNALNDAAGKWSPDSVAPDLPEYLNSSQVARLALRTARDLKATDEDWMEFIRLLKEKQKER